MTDATLSLVCPSCEHVEDAPETEPAADCPECGSDRAYLTPEPALPDADSETYVKMDPDAVDEN